MGLKYLYKTLIVTALLASGIVGLVILPANSVRAVASSTGNQTVFPPDCSLPDSCQVDPPTIYSGDNIPRRPVIQGTYDAAYTQVLRVKFNGFVYTLGVDSQLSARDGVWTLSLSNLNPPLTNGDYTIAVEAVGYTGQLVDNSIVVKVDYHPPKHPDSGSGIISGAAGNKRPGYLGPFYQSVDTFDSNLAGNDFRLSDSPDEIAGYLLGDDIQADSFNWLRLVIICLLCLAVVLLIVYRQQIGDWLHNSKDGSSRSGGN